MANTQKIMSAKEIHKWLDRIEARIGKEEPAVLHRELDEIFQYKPVDNHYFLVRGKVYFSEKKYGKVDMTLSAKNIWWIPGPYTPMMAELHYDTRAATGAKELTRHAILGYYVCKMAMHEWNRGRKMHYHPAFFKMAEEVYQTELEEKERLENALREETDFGRIREAGARLTDCYWHLWRTVQCALAKMAAVPEGQEIRTPEFNKLLDRWILAEPNMGYFVRRVLAGREEGGFLLIVSEKNRAEQYAAARFLSAIGCRVTVLEQPVTVELDCMVDVRDTVEVSLSNRERSGGVDILYPCALFLNGEFAGENTDHLLRYLLGQTADGYLDVLADRVTLTGAGFHNLTEYKGAAITDDLCYGYAGDYGAYLSRAFSYDYRKGIGKQAKCRFSIIIPARNSAYTLQYTLKTCLNLRGVEPGEYEIIISDNSDLGNTDVENLIKNLGDDRVKYYRTPAVLPLTKSFEFAYGKAEGEYILTLGSDDGLLPWCLEVLKDVCARYPQMDAIGWIRGTFHWTESVSSQRGKFLIPNNFKRGYYEDVVFDSRALLKGRLDKDSEGIYALPLGYINSIVKREFLLRILDRTGTLLDSYTQDFALGMKMMLYTESVVLLNYSLSIAGMSDSSLGARMVAQVSSDEEAEKRMRTMSERGIGGTVVFMDSPFWPITTTEGMFWAEVFRMLREPALSDTMGQLLEDHDWKKTLYELTVHQDTDDVGCFLLYEKIRYSAYCIGEEIGRWYDRELYYWLLDVMERRAPAPADPAAAPYNTGFLEGGGLQLDAGKFGVKTIDEAVELFANITNM